MRFAVVGTRLGDLLVVADQGVKETIKKIYLPGRGGQKRLAQDFPGAKKMDPPARGICPALAQYLEGERTRLPLSALDMGKGSMSQFRKAVLLALAAVPRGKVISYSALASKAGAPGAARAVGTAMAQNPFPIAIPCHRAVRSDRTLGGFGGGLKMKRALLEMEGIGFDETGRVKKGFFWK